MKEGSALLVALAVAAGVAYWSDHYRIDGWGPTPPTEGPFPYERSAAPGHAPASEQPAREKLEVHEDQAGKAGLCAELLEVIQGVDAALLSPQSPAAAEQLINRRRAYVEKRIALGC